MKPEKDVKRSCAICGDGGPHPAWEARNLREPSPERFTYFRCSGCGCLQIGSVPDDLASYYGAGYYSVREVPRRKLADPPVKGFFRRLAARVCVSPAVPFALVDRLFSLPPHMEWFRRAGVGLGSRILDVGCGSGELLLRIRKEGFTGVEGLEPHIEEDIVYPNGLRVRKGSLEDLEGEPPYDFIMLNHSFEHIPDQHLAMEDLKRALAPGGRAMLRVPVGDCEVWEEYGTDWVQLDPPRHLYLHSEESMAVLAEWHGLRVFDTVYDSEDFQFTGSELCRKGVPIDDHRDYIRENPFDPATLKRFRERTEKLNREGRGDMACFYLERARGR